MELHLVGLFLSVSRLPFFLSVAFRLTVTSFVFSFVFSIRSLSFLSLFLRFSAAGFVRDVSTSLCLHQAVLSLLCFFISLSLSSVSLFPLYFFFVLWHPLGFTVFACSFLCFFASFLLLSALTFLCFSFTVPRPLSN